MGAHVRCTVLSDQVARVARGPNRSIRENGDSTLAVVSDSVRARQLDVTGGFRFVLFSR